MHNEIKLKIAKEIESSIKESFDDVELKIEDIYNGLSETPNLKMGQFAFACFPLAKALKSSPVEIAKKIHSAINKSDDIQEVLLQGPYVNFKVSPILYGKSVIDQMVSKDFFKKELTKDKFKTMIEYSQPNTHKEMHVGHMRNLCLGNAIVKIKSYCDQEVIPVTYPGDSGTHVAKCLWYLKYHSKEDTPKENKGEWLGKIYSTANLKLEDELGTDKEERNREQLTEILKELHSEKGEFYDLWKETREWSLELMKQTYDWASVEFDRWFFESEMDQPSVDICNEYYEKGVFIKDQGAIGVNLEEEKLGFCILIKSDGTGLYATKDVALAKKKFEEFGVQKNIYIVDSRQAFHFKQVFKVLEKIGFEQAKDCYHLPYEMVELKNGAMSSRKGNVVPLFDLITQMQHKITTQYLEKYRGEWSDEDIETTAKMIANGAIKYGMVKMDNNRKIVFDMDEWLKLDGDTGPYLQYVHARISSLLQKNGEPESIVNYDTLEKDQEIALLNKLSHFNDIVFKSHESFKTNTLTTYLYELCKLFNSFYADCPISSSEKDLKNARLALSLAVKNTVAKGLSLIGIQAPEKM